MSQTKRKQESEFRFLYELEENELRELRKFLEPKIDLSSLKGFSQLLDRLNHLLDE